MMTMRGRPIGIRPLVDCDEDIAIISEKREPSFPGNSDVPDRRTTRDRHRAREAALQMLYQWEVGHGEAAEVPAGYWMLDREGAPATPAVRELAERLALGDD